MESRIRECFAKVYRFTEKWLNEISKDNAESFYNNLLTDCKRMEKGDPFIADLMPAIYREIDREYKRRIKNGRQ